MKTKIGILISGRGSNMLALAAAIREGRVPEAEIALVVSDQPGAAGLAHAQAQNLPTAVVERRGRPRDEHDRELVTVLQEHQVGFVCLAGYMRLLSAQVLSAYRNRILNIHPSLLPAFPGLDAQRQALEHGAKFTGCTVHFVDETLDGGPIILQAVVPILDDDTPETLAARILKEEHRIYSEAIELVLSGRCQMRGSRVIIQ